MRGALGEVVATKELLPDNTSFTVMCASTRWGRTGVRPGSGLASPDTPAAMPNSSITAEGAARERCSRT